MEKEKELYCKCLYHSSNALSRNITRMAEKAFKPFSLPPSYAFILITVNKKPGICAGSLASIMQLQPSTVTRLTEKLESQKYIHRTHDGKFVIIFPLHKSMELQEKLVEAWGQLYADYVKILGEERATLLTSEINEVSALLEKH